MKDYFNFVENLATNKTNKVFLNSGPIHASIVMSRIFKYSQSKVQIYNGGFSGAVSNDPVYLETLEGFLKRKNTKLEILVEDNDKLLNSKIYSILCKYSDKIDIAQTDLKLAYIDEESDDNSNTIHFTVGDESMVRIETNPDDFSAQVNFNSEIGQDLSRIFGEMLNSKNNNKVILS